MESIRRWHLAKIAPEAQHRLRKVAVVLQSQQVAQQQQPQQERTGGEDSSQNDWCLLPDHLLEKILLQLLRLVVRDGHPTSLLPVCGVCNGWRRVARELLFRNSWRRYNTLAEPDQLFSLSPWPRDGGLLKCFVRREQRNRFLAGLGGRLFRFTLWLAADPRAKDARFLICAVQQTKSSFTLHLDKEGSGPAVAVLHSNLLRTRYSLAPSASFSWLPRALQRAGYFSGPAAQEGRQQEEGGADKQQPAQQQPAQQLAQLMGVHYKIRVKGMMMPRRMFVELPCPVHLHDHPTYPEVPPHVLACAGRLPAFDNEELGLDAAAWQQLQQQQLQEQQQQQEADFEEVDEFGSDEGEGLGEVGDEAGVVGLDDEELQGHMEEWDMQLQQQQQQQQQQDGLPAQEQLWRNVSAAGSDSTSLRPWSPGSAASAASHAPRAALRLQNKPPHWNEALRCWCLNFRGRVKLASVKNFQLVSSSDVTGRVLLQFGKVERNVFVLDFNPCVISSAQAFAICLTSFETKLLL